MTDAGSRAGKVRILPERVANQIAAGEVVERPASVVKELLENALDAGARRVEVEFRQGGRLLMRVEDDGCGMSREDAELAFRRHATSKIAEAADLDRLATFGFRGEALPSIASVSTCTLKTREAGSEAGTEILFDAGKLVHARACGCPVGTRVEVARLFDPVPARRKFLKSDRTEAAHLSQCVRLYALAAPEVAFTLLEDGRTVFRSPACPGLAERVAEIFGRRFASDLAPLDAEEGGYRLRGLIGRPGVWRPSRHDTIVFVNSRPVDSRILAYSLAEGCREWLPEGGFPPAALFFDCDPAAVDVNVHPSKREVRFRNEGAVRAFVATAARRRLERLASTFAKALEETASLPGRLAEPPPKPAGWAVPRREIRGEPASPPAAPAAAAEDAPSEALRQGPAWRYLGFVQERYAVLEAPSGLILVDRKAALERIWLERMQAEGADAASQRLLVPVPFEADAIAEALLLDQRKELSEHGFEISDFGRGFFRIEAVPAWLEPGEAEPFLRGLLGAIREEARGGAAADLFRNHLAGLAAARASRLGGPPGEAEIRSLLTQLFGTRAPLVSPSGHPTCVELGRGELARRFEK